MFAAKLNEHRHDDMEGMDVVDPTTRSEDDGEDQIDADQADLLTTAVVAPILFPLPNLMLLAMRMAMTILPMSVAITIWREWK